MVFSEEEKNRARKMSSEKEDGLGLSLSLGIMSCPQNNHKTTPSLPLNLLPFMHHHQVSSGKSCKDSFFFALFCFIHGFHGLS